MPSSSWVIGSHGNVPATTLSITVGATTEQVVVSSGGYYVHDLTSTRSAITTFANAVASHSLITTCTGTLTEGRLSRFVADAAFTCTFDDNTLRDLLGLTGNLTTSQTTQTGDEPSGYMWVPGKFPVEMAPPGTQGLRRYDTSVGEAGPGQVRPLGHNQHTVNEFDFNAVCAERGWPVVEDNGSFIAFFRTCLRMFYKIKHYRGLPDEDASTTAIDLSSVTLQGPYIMNPGRGDVAEQYEETVKNAYNAYHRISLPVVSTTEYT